MDIKYKFRTMYSPYRRLQGQYSYSNNIDLHQLLETKEQIILFKSNLHNRPLLTPKYNDLSEFYDFSFPILLGHMG